METSTFIFPAEDEEMSELKSMFAPVKKNETVLDYFLEFSVYAVTTL